MLKNIDLIVFDWDGTLMDSVGKIIKNIHYAAAQMNAKKKTDDEVRHIIGLGLNEAIWRLYPEQSLDFSEAFAEHYRGAYLDSQVAPSRMFEGANDVLLALRRAGYHLAVATGKARRGLTKALQDSGHMATFDVTRCADETRSKPHPLMLEEIMTDMDCAPANTLMIGDSEYDLQMAQAAGVQAVAVSYGVHTEKHLATFDPITCLHDIRDLLNFV
ncbi:MAG: HAD-IA family hydrolase [Gammaproteobacteria bacterium]|nr:HAD-IA family hydrolase [Gammaproteobacteria bacterium]